MPEQNAENLRRVLEDWDPHRDLEGWKHGNPGEVLTLLDPQIAYEDTVLPDHVGETYRGHEGIVRATERWLEPFDDFTVELDRIIGTGERLVSVHRFRGKAHHTGIELDGVVAYAWTFRDGKVVHLKSFSAPEDALREAGLDE
jgi:ketosteroid isomerase-like protein